MKLLIFSVILDSHLGNHLKNNIILEDSNPQSPNPQL